MFDPIKTRAFGQYKQARYLKEAESRRLIKASKAGKPGLHAYLARRMGQWLILMGQRLQSTSTPVRGTLPPHEI